MALMAPEDPCPSYYRYVINVLACVLILVIFCRYSPQGHLWSANHCVIRPPLICPPLYRFPGCAYGPSNPFDYPPPYPISESAEIVPIIAYPCHVRVDHFRVIFVSGEFKPGLLVQDNTWDGPLCVVRYVARGGLEMVAECVGRDVDGQRIVRFLVVSNFRVHRRWESGELIQSQYPEALASCKYVRKAFVNDTLPVPGPIFPVPFYPDGLVLPPSYSPFVGPPPSNPLAIFANTIFAYMCR